MSAIWNILTISKELRKSKRRRILPIVQKSE
jgi:hypothetical protein